MTIRSWEFKRERIGDRDLSSLHIDFHEGSLRFSDVTWLARYCEGIDPATPIDVKVTDDGVSLVVPLPPMTAHEMVMAAVANACECGEDVFLRHGRHHFECPEFDGGA